MSKVLRYEFETDATLMVDGITLASATANKGNGRVVSMILQVSVAFLSAAGGSALAVFLYRVMAGPGQAPLWILVLGVAFGLWLNIYFFQHLVSQLAKTSAQGRFHSGTQWVEVTPVGFTYGNAHSRWFTEWTAIEEVVESKTSVMAMAGAVGLFMPKSAIGDAEEVAELMEQMRAWHAAARE